MTKKIIYRAGLIPLFINPDNIEDSKMMFMIPSNDRFGGDNPQMAKGQIESDESPKEAAIREAQEELGLRLSSIIDVVDCGTWLGRTSVFVAIVNTDDPNDYDKPHFETRETMWLTRDQFNEVGRDIHVPVINDICDLIFMSIERDPYMFGLE